MTSEDLESAAQQAVDAILALSGPGTLTSPPRKAIPGLKTSYVEFLPGKSLDAAITLSRSVKDLNIHRFVVRKADQEIPGCRTAVVTQDGVSVRATAQCDVSGREYGRIGVMGLS